MTWASHVGDTDHFACSSSSNRCDRPLLILFESLELSSHAAAGRMEFVDLLQHRITGPGE
jgi:hypothetical protein